jgi:NADH-quinone oxidoreductase subunit A
MENLISSYLPIFIFLILALGLAFIMIGLPFIAATISHDKEKISPYECGFEPFENARAPFDVKFYLVSILFIIFDLEIAFLFPWAIVLPEIGILGFWSMMFFLLMLTVGFAYEWKKGALEWK